MRRPWQEVKLIDDLRIEWQRRESPSYEGELVFYQLDHAQVSTLLNYIQRLQSSLNEANARALRFANRMDKAELELAEANKHHHKLTRNPFSGIFHCDCGYTEEDLKRGVWTRYGDQEKG